MAGNLTKLRELVLYIVKATEGERAFGRIKLAKVLFVADFKRYAQTGEPITGARYVKARYGPMPDSLVQAVKSLTRDGSAKETRPKFYNLTQKRLTALREPDLSGFEQEDLRVVDRVIQMFRCMTGTDVSEWSHDYKPWKAARLGEEIPYYTVFAMSDLNPGEKGIAWAKRELERLRKDESYSH